MATNGMRAAWARIVDRAREDLFTSSCFAGDQHAGVRARDFLDELEDSVHRRAVTDDVLEVIPALDLFAQSVVLRSQSIEQTGVLHRNRS